MRELTHLALLVPGFVFFWTLLRVDPVPKAYSYGVSLWITAAEVVGDAFLGLAVIASTSLIGAGYYHALARPWGPSLQTDQILGGGTLWIFGDLVGLPFLVAQLIQFIREDEAEAAVIDAELDAREAVRAEPGSGPRAAAEPGSGPRAAAGRRRRRAGRTQSRGGAGQRAQSPSGAGARSRSCSGRRRPGPGDPDRPWWEDDPRFNDRFGQV